MGLWFNEKVLDAVFEKGMDSLRRNLEAWGVTTFTMNAFPQGDFHEPVVKKKVYSPDWTDPARLRYTLRCAEVLAAILPENGFGSISTLPLGWRVGWTPEHSRLAAEALMKVVRHCVKTRDRTGKTVALALEPEPGCVLERTPQVIAFWKDVLRPAASHAGWSDVLDAHLGLCYDTCHQAVQFENPEEALSALSGAGIPIHKMQLSSALEFPGDPDVRSRARREPFVEPRFLHQTRVKSQAEVLDFDDLPEVLNTGSGFFAHPWRVHYHVPVQANALGTGVGTTREDMLRALRYALKHDLCSHFEVETYTWSVLPESHRPESDEALAQCLAKELTFIREQVPGVFDHA